MKHQKESQIVSLYLHIKSEFLIYRFLIFFSAGMPIGGAQLVRQLQWGYKDSAYQRLTDFRGAILSSCSLSCFLHSWVSEEKEIL